METFFRQKAVLSRKQLRNSTVQNEKETQPPPGDLRAVWRAHDMAHEAPDIEGELLSPQYQVTPFGAARCVDSFSIAMTKHHGQSNKRKHLIWGLVFQGLESSATIEGRIAAGRQAQCWSGRGGGEGGGERESLMRD